MSTGIALPVNSRASRLLSWFGPLGMVALVTIVALTLVAMIAPVLAPHDPDSLDLISAYQGPSPGHALGTDGLGRDLLSRLIWGSRSALLGPLLVVLLSSVTGVSLALVAAWQGGWVDALVSRLMDALFAFPGLLLALLAVAVFGPGLQAAIVALSIAYLPYIGRVTRGAAIQQTKQPYIAAIELQGASGLSIAIHHLLPNLAPLILAQATVAFGYALVDLAAISYLGFGVQQPTADWGSMVSTGQPDILRGSPAQALCAGALIIIAVASFIVVGEKVLHGSREDVH